MELPYEINELLASGFFKSVLDKKSEKTPYSRSQVDRRYSLKDLISPKKKAPRLIVEDEVESLLRELSPIIPNYDPPLRGSINQDPIIIEAESKTPEPITLHHKACAKESKSRPQRDFSKEAKIQKKSSSSSENDDHNLNGISSRDYSEDEIRRKPRRKVKIMSSRSGSSSPNAPEKSRKHRHHQHDNQMGRRSSSPRKNKLRQRSSSPQNNSARTSNNSSPSREGRLVHANHSRKEISLRPELLTRSHKEIEKRNLKCPAPLTLKRRDPSQPRSNQQISNFPTSNNGNPNYYRDYLSSDSGHYSEVDDLRPEIRNSSLNQVPYIYDLPTDYPSTFPLDNSQACNYPYVNGTYTSAPGMSYSGLNGGYVTPYIHQPSMPAYDGYGVPSVYSTPSTALVEKKHHSYQPEWQPSTFQTSPANEADGKIIRFPGKVINHLPPCPRTKFSHGKTGWLTLPQCPNFDICSFCFESSVAPTEFEKFFITSPRPAPSTGTLCDFGSSPWYRIAWLTILTKNLKSLNLFYELADVAVSVPPCPENEKTVGYWWTIVDPWSGNLMPGFRVCLNCVNNIEVFFPMLRGVFVCTEKFDAWPCACHMRINKKRFIRFFDMLEIIAADAESQGLPADTRPLARLIDELEDVS